MSLDPPTEVEADILESAKAIDDLIDDEIERGTPADRIVLGGFSQGAAMTLLTGLTTQHQIAGLIVLSGRLPMREKFKTVSPIYSVIVSNIYSYCIDSSRSQAMSKNTLFSGDMGLVTKLSHTS